jgi:membrane-associated HD superfamily phosphohydrolase
MTPEELTNYFVDKKIKGATYREIANIFDNNEIDVDTRKLIMSKLDVVDKKQNELLKKAVKSNKKKSGIIALLIGIGIVIFGFILYASSAKAGVIFIFNFVVWGFGGLLILRGLLNFIAGFIKD